MTSLMLRHRVTGSQSILNGVISSFNISKNGKKIELSHLSLVDISTNRRLAKHVSTKLMPSMSSNV